MILWDARMPIIVKPQEYPHMIFWTTTGLVKKILLKNTPPSSDFWLAQSQIDLIDDGAEIKMWPGEIVYEEMVDTDSESDGETDLNDDTTSKSKDTGYGKKGKESKEKRQKRREQRKRDELFGKDDVREALGASLGVVMTDAEGVKTEATEYVPGGELVITVQAVGNPFVEAYLSVAVIDTLYDAFSPSSGQIMGKFVLDAPLPWDKGVLEDAARRASNASLKSLPARTRDIPLGLTTTRDDQACVYTAAEITDNGKETPLPGAFSILWRCPDPDLGDAVVTVNLKRKNERKWSKLTYSLKESSMRSEISPLLILYYFVLIINWAFD